MSPELNKRLVRRVARTNRAMKVSFVAMVISVIALLGFIIAQQYATQQQLTKAIEDLKNTAKQNHEETRQYNKCLLEAIGVPIGPARDTALNACGVADNAAAGGDGTSEQGVQSSATTMPTSTSVQPVKPQPTTSGGPDPEAPVASSGQSAGAGSVSAGLDGLPLIGPVIKGINNLL